MKAAKTIAEAQQQTYTVPTQFDDKTWRSFAGLINGYAIAEELGFNLIEWGNAQVAAHKTGDKWTLTELELRLLLFYAYRADYMSGYTYHEQDELVDELLAALAAVVGQPYTPNQMS
jgi:hypothetical protein